MKQMPKREKPNKTVIAQFGEGNFLRAFCDHMIDIANEKGVFAGGVAIIKPISLGNLDALREQNLQYNVILRGLENGEKVVGHRLVSCITEAIDPFSDYAAYENLAKNADLRFVISNTTEAGIVFDATDDYESKPANTFPGKLTQFLYTRFTHFDGDTTKGLIVLPCELIEKNGAKLRECVMQYSTLWNLPSEFAVWLESACTFCNTLVDRIVSGYPAEEAEDLQRNLLGHEDKLMVVGEPFAFWAIESARFHDVQKAFPLDKAGLPVVFCENLTPYRDRKVRLLNGGHTASVLAAFLAGWDTVGQMMADDTCSAFLKQVIFDEIAPVVALPAEEVADFSNSVLERFENPFIRHELLSIALNSVSKWKARVLPSLKDHFAKKGSLPKGLCFSLAALASFYRSAEQDGEQLIGKRENDTYPIRDDAHVLAFFKEHSTKSNSEFASLLLQNERFWGEDLTKIGDFLPLVVMYLDEIAKRGMKAALINVTEGA